MAEARPEAAIGDLACVNALFELEDETYMVDNDALKSKSKGIRYRLSPSLTDVDQRPGGQRIARFGDMVVGVPFPDGWLMVGGFAKRRFLPKNMQNVPVLVRMRAGGEAAEAHIAADLASPTLVNSTAESSSPTVKSQKEPQVCKDGKVVFRSPPMVARPVVAQEPALVRLIDSELPDKEALSAGVVSLLRLIRKEMADVNMKDSKGRTPLLLAARRGYLDYCVILIEAGADATVITRRGLPADQWPGREDHSLLSELARGPVVRALVQAVSGGGDFEMTDFNAGLEKLMPQVRPIAEQLFQQHSPFLAERRRDGATIVPSSGSLRYMVRPDLEFVPMHSEPSTSSSRIARVASEEIVEVLAYDKTRNWVQARAQGEPGEEDIVGWMPIQHDVMGKLLVPVSHKRAWA